MSQLQMRDRVIKTLQYTDRNPGVLRFVAPKEIGEDGKPGSYRIMIQHVADVSGKYVVDFQQTTSWDDSVDTGPMIIDPSELV